MTRLTDYSSNSSDKGNTLCVEFGWVTLFFSYRTLVGVRVCVQGKEARVIVSSNAWGATTGRHIGDIRRLHKNCCVLPHGRFVETVGFIQRVMLMSWTPELTDEVYAVMGDEGATART
jgi:hypothetical protein